MLMLSPRLKPRLSTRHFGTFPDFLRHSSKCERLVGGSWSLRSWLEVYVVAFVLLHLGLQRWPWNPCSARPTEACRSWLRRTLLLMTPTRRPLFVWFSPDPLAFPKWPEAVTLLRRIHGSGPSPLAGLSPLIHAGRNQPNRVRRLSARHPASPSPNTRNWCWLITSVGPWFGIPCLRRT